MFRDARRHGIGRRRVTGRSPMKRPMCGTLTSIGAPLKV